MAVRTQDRPASYDTGARRSGRPDPAAVQVRASPGSRDDPELVWSQSDSPPTALWAPRSGDALVALGQVLPLVSERIGDPITRVSLHIGDWLGDQPRLLIMGGHKVRLGWFRTMPAMTVTVAHGSGSRVVLSVQEQPDTGSATPGPLAVTP